MKMELKVLAEIKNINISLNDFWDGLNVFLVNPHLINKRILSSVIFYKKKLDSNNLLTIINKILNCNNGNDISTEEDLIPSQVLILPDDDDDDDEEKIIQLIVKKLFPKDDTKFSLTLEFIIIDKSNNRIIFLSNFIDKKKKCLTIEWPYEINYKNQGEIIISGKINCNVNHSNVEWLINKLFPKLIKWMETSVTECQLKQNLVQGSLNIIPNDRYCYLYNHLKKKYGLDIVNKWTECTDPQKFVYEDVAIATYLLILWEEERKEKNIINKQSFVDLGCGNGLLAYILTNEGHSGVGIDLRRRKIWDLFSNSTNLQEKTIIPSSKFLFPNVDWLIGNHSDELTPWIPVIAARSSYHCRFFLLPCCAHEFDGKKFQRHSASNSQYHEYLKYIKYVCNGCGFETKIDKLRIPSTKRICFIGWDRIYSESQIKQQDKLIENIINARSVNDKTSDEKNEMWNNEFKPREIIEKVRNCTQIDKKVIDEIINLVTQQLLKKVRIININNDPDKRWNAGGKIELAKIAKIIPQFLLKEIKNECGGLQTLFKNNNNIFEIVNGSVQFKIPGDSNNHCFSKKNKRKKKLTNIQFKVKPCWFFHNHPDGCPLDDEICTFKHI